MEEAFKTQTTMIYLALGVTAANMTAAILGNLVHSLNKGTKTGFELSSCSPGVIARMTGIISVPGHTVFANSD